MNKKITLLGLVVAAAALSALPAAASAQEIHWTNVEKGTGSSGAGTIQAEGEPTFSCSSGDITWTPSAGGTTGSYHWDHTGCKESIFGAACHTSGSPLNNTITTSGTYHVITINGKPGTLLTPLETTIICTGFFTSVVKGNLLGTITSPACGGESKKLTESFSATGSTQNHLAYTGTNYTLTSTTSGSSAKPAGFTTTFTAEQATAGKLECT
jgi:opacity protein-like surface antigen